MSRRCGSSKPTPTPLNGEARSRQGTPSKKGKKGVPIRKGQKHRQTKTSPYHLERGGGANTCQPKSEKLSCATTAARGGDAKLHHRKGATTKKSHSPVPQSEWQKIPRTPPVPRGGVRQDKKKTNTKKEREGLSPCLTDEMQAGAFSLRRPFVRQIGLGQTTKYVLWAMTKKCRFCARASGLHFVSVIFCD